MKAIRFVMIGGFLGAGKTTLISQLARRFHADGNHVCVVTNDQAAGLVDTELLRSQGLEVNEVAGSCFCCNFDGLTGAIEAFNSHQTPDVVLAEPVGSCTDLIATIALPMERKLGAKFLHSPYTVVLKPSHGLRILTGSGRGGFSPKAEYIFLKQLEESELILLNRIDEISQSDVTALTEALTERFPGRKIINASAKTGENLDALYAELQQSAPPRSHTMQVDYDTYAEGEAELGWLNATAIMKASVSALVLDDLTVNVVEQIRQRLAVASAEPAHLKVLAYGSGQASVANLVSRDSPVMLSISSEARASEVKLTLNARVAIEPDELESIIRSVLGDIALSLGGELAIAELSAFRPDRPVPTHRIELE